MFVLHSLLDARLLLLIPYQVGLIFAMFPFAFMH